MIFKMRHPLDTTLLFLDKAYSLPKEIFDLFIKAYKESDSKHAKKEICQMACDMRIMHDTLKLIVNK
jgi:hypothetical protein